MMSLIETVLCGTAKMLPKTDLSNYVILENSQYQIKEHQVYQMNSPEFKIIYIESYDDCRSCPILYEGNLTVGDFLFVLEANSHGTNLRLSNCSKLTNDVCKSVCKIIDSLEELRVVSISWSFDNSEEIQNMISDSISRFSLEFLDLYELEVGDDIFTLFHKIKTKNLWLSSSFLSGIIIKDLVENIHALESLVIRSCNNIYDTDHVRSMLETSSIKELCLDKIGFDDDIINDVVKSLRKNKTLKTLKIKSCMSMNEHAKRLFRSLRRSSIKKLYLNNINFGMSMYDIFANINNTKLTLLSLDGCNVISYDYTCLLKSLQKTNLQHVELPICQNTMQTTADIANLIKNNLTIKTLKFNTTLNHEAARVIIDSLKENYLIEKLDCGNNMDIFLTEDDNVENFNELLSENYRKRVYAKKFTKNAMSAYHKL